MEPVEPPPSDLFHAALEQGKAHRRVGDVVRAEQAFQRASDIRPERPEPLLERARMYWSQGDVEVAEDLLRQAVVRFPALPMPSVLLARLLVQRDAAGQAAQVIEAGIARCPGHPLLLLAEGELRLHQRAYQRAEGCFQEALVAGAAPASVRAGLARLSQAEGSELVAEGRLTEAAFRFKRAADLNPRWADPLLQLGVVMGRLGNQRRSGQLLGKAAALSPTSAEAHYQLGAVLERTGELSAALSAFERAVRCDPLHPLARRALGELCAVRQPGRALLLLAEEAGRSPSDSRLWVRLGEVCLRLGDRRQAARCFEQALLRGEGDLSARELLPFLKTRRWKSAKGRNPRPGPLSKSR